MKKKGGGEFSLELPLKNGQVKFCEQKERFLEIGKEEGMSQAKIMGKKICLFRQRKFLNYVL